MSFLFDNALNEWLYNEAFSGAVAAPLTLSCWFNCDEDGTQFLTPISIGDKDSSVDYFGLQIMAADTNDPIRATTRSVSGRVQASINGVTFNRWHHAAGVYVTSASRFVFLDGVKSSENTGDITPLNIDTIHIGSIVTGSPSGQDFSGMVGEVAVYNVALTDFEVLRLSKGESAKAVRPENLVFFLDLKKKKAIDEIGNLIMSENGSPVFKSENPRVFNKFDYRLNYGFLTVSGGIIYDMSGVGEIGVEGAALLNNLVAMVGTGEIGVEGSANISALLGMVASGEIAIQGSANLTALRSMIATGEIAVQGAAAIIALIGMSATGEIEVSGTAALAGTFGLSATGEIAVQGQAVLNIIATMAATGEIEVSGSGDLTFVGVDEFDNVVFFTVTKRGDILAESFKHDDILPEVIREGI